MISFQQIRKFCLIMVLTIMLAVTIAFDFGTANSWAATSLTAKIGQPQSHIATMNPVEEFAENVKGKVQGAIDNMTGDSQDQTIEEPNQFKAQTLEGMDNSIQNANYQPSGKTKQAKKEDREAIKEIETGVRDTFNWESTTK
jgi:uncharacterized protein YjbJ (UPF0337 family)